MRPLTLDGGETRELSDDDTTRVGQVWLPVIGSAPPSPESGVTLYCVQAEGVLQLRARFANNVDKLVVDAT